MTTPDEPLNTLATVVAEIRQERFERHRANRILAGAIAFALVIGLFGGLGGWFAYTSARDARDTLVRVNQAVDPNSKIGRRNADATRMALASLNSAADERAVREALAVLACAGTADLTESCVRAIVTPPNG